MMIRRSMRTKIQAWARRRSAMRTSAAALLAAVVLGGCSQAAQLGEPLTGEDRYVGESTEARMAFWHSMTERPIVSNAEAFYALRLFFEGKTSPLAYEEQVEALKSRGWLPAGFDAPPDAAVRRGVLAQALTEALEIEGGVMMRLLGPSPRYATRELQYLDIYPTSSPQQVFSGADFVGLMGRVEDYQRKHHPEKARQLARTQVQRARKAQRVADRREAAMRAVLAQVRSADRRNGSGGAHGDAAEAGDQRHGYVRTAAFGAPEPSEAVGGSGGGFTVAQAEEAEQQSEQDGESSDQPQEEAAAEDSQNGADNGDAAGQEGEAAADAEAEEAQADGEQGEQPESRQRVVVVTGVQGLVQARADEEADWQTVEEGMQLGLGTELRTGPRSAVRFAVGETQTVTVDRLGTVKIVTAIEREDEIKTDVGMQYGRSSLEVEAGGVEHESTIRSPSARLSVRGSKGMLWQDAGGSSRVVASGHEGDVAWRNTKGQWIPLPPGSEQDNGDSSSVDNAEEDNNNDEMRLARTDEEHELRGDHSNGFFDNRQNELDGFRGHDTREDQHGDQEFGGEG